MNTKQVKLGSLCTITSSKRIFESEYVEEGIPFYRSKEIIERESGKTTSSNIHITKERYNEIKEKFGVPKPNEMLITSVGTLGVPYIVKDSDLFYFKDGNLTWLKNFSKALNSRYLYYWIKSDFGKQSLVQRAIGSSQPAITIDILKKYQILIPDIVYQNKIVSVLSIYDDLIEKNNRKIEILQDMAEELYKEWFVRFRFPGYKTAKFTDGIPDGWEVKRCGDISMIKAGGDAPKEYSGKKTDKYKYPIFSNGISEDGLYGYTDKPSIKEESITISARGTVGYVCLRNEPYLPIVRLLVIVPNTEIVSNIFLYMYFKHNAAEGYGTSQQQITVPYFKKKKILLPSQELVNRYTEYVEPFFMEIRKLKQLNSNLTIQRDLLLPRLMSGKLAVKVS